MSVDTNPIGNHYDKYGTTNPIERKLMKNFFDAIDRAMPAQAFQVLEIGVGEGHVITRVGELLNPDRMIGLDLPDPDLATHWKGLDVATMFADAEQLPFSDNQFDLVIAVEVLEHVFNPNKVLSEIARVGGQNYVLSVPREPIWRVANAARGKYLGDLGNTPGHVNHWSKGGFGKFVAQELKVQSVQSPFPWTVISAYG